jgi:nicotinamide mononucleotide transporter
MSFPEIFQQFLAGLKQTSLLEYIAVIFGIGSVWYSKKENILVYPVGLVNNIVYVYLSVKGHLLGEASVNIFYAVISIYGWVLWTKRDRHRHHLVQIRWSTAREWIYHLSFFAAIYIVIYLSLVIAKRYFTPGAIPWADALASSTAFTGMWLMAKKKVESWYWWIATNMASIPLYFVKGYVFTSVYYLVLLVMAFSGLAEWSKKASEPPQAPYTLHNKEA